MAKMKLSTSERRFIAFGVIALASMAGYLLLQAPLDNYSKSKTLVQEAEANLKHAQSLQATFKSLKVGNQKALASLPDVSPRSLVSIINDAEKATELAGTKKVAIENASTGIRIDDPATNRARLVQNLETFRVTLRGVSVEELVTLLHMVHDEAGILLIENVNHLRPAQDEQGLDCQLVLSKVIPNQGA